MRLAAVSGQSMPKPSFFPKDLLVEETLQAARRRTRQARAKAQVRPNARKQSSPRMRRASKLCSSRGKKLSKYDIGKPCKTIGDVCS